MFKFGYNHKVSYLGDRRHSNLICLEGRSAVQWNPPKRFHAYTTLHIFFRQHKAFQILYYEIYIIICVISHWHAGAVSHVSYQTPPGNERSSLVRSVWIVCNIKPRLYLHMMSRFVYLQVYFCIDSVYNIQIGI